MIRISDRISEDIERILDGKAGNYDYEVQVGIMPTKDGDNMVIAQFFFFTKNPILGEGDLVAVEVMPLELTKVDAALTALVDRCIAFLREQHAAALAR